MAVTRRRGSVASDIDGDPCGERICRLRWRMGRCLQLSSIHDEANVLSVSDSLEDMQGTKVLWA